MKRKYITVPAALLCISILAGCQETPENSIVKQKGSDNIKEYESSEGSIHDMVKAPETYKNLSSYENGALVIDTDAEVILPEVASINTYNVSAQEADQEMIDKVTEFLFLEL